MKIKCPNSECASALRVSDSLVGKTRACPKCGTKFTVSAKNAPDKVSPIDSMRSGRDASVPNQFAADDQAHVESSSPDADTADSFVVRTIECKFEFLSKADSEELPKFSHKQVIEIFRRFGREFGCPKSKSVALCRTEYALSVGGSRMALVLAAVVLAVVLFFAYAMETYDNQRIAALIMLVVAFPCALGTYVYFCREFAKDAKAHDGRQLPKLQRFALVHRHEYKLTILPLLGLPKSVGNYFSPKIEYTFTCPQVVEVDLHRILVEIESVPQRDDTQAADGVEQKRIKLEFLSGGTPLYMSPWHKEDSQNFVSLFEIT